MRAHHAWSARTTAFLGTHRPARISELETGKRHNRDLAQRYQQHLTHLTT